MLFRPLAKEDLIEIWTFVARRNLRAADEVLAAIEATAALLAEHPSIGTEVRSENSRLTGLRFHTLKRFRNYGLYYFPLVDGIDVVRVLERHRNARVLLEGGD